MIKLGMLSVITLGLLAGCSSPESNKLSGLSGGNVVTESDIDIIFNQVVKPTSLERDMHCDPLGLIENTQQYNVLHSTILLNANKKEILNQETTTIRINRDYDLMDNTTFVPSKDLVSDFERSNTNINKLNVISQNESTTTRTIVNASDVSKTDSLTDGFTWDLYSSTPKEFTNASFYFVHKNMKLINFETAIINGSSISIPTIRTVGNKASIIKNMHSFKIKHSPILKSEDNPSDSIYSVGFIYVCPIKP